MCKRWHDMQSNNVEYHFYRPPQASEYFAMCTYDGLSVCGQILWLWWHQDHQSQLSSCVAQVKMKAEFDDESA